MIKVKEIYQFLDKLSPFELQEEWDNSSLQVGSLNSEVEKIYISLDLDEEQLERIEDNSLIITHHPLIFKPLKTLDIDLYPANLIAKLIKKECSLISMHTNFDKTHLNRYVANEILGFDEMIEESDFILTFKVDFTLEELTSLLKNKLGIETLKVVNPKESIKTIALTTGSGGDLIPLVKADVYLTGDIKYHQAMLAKESGLMLIDIGHYESEIFFSQLLISKLQNFAQKAIIVELKNPFLTY